MPRISTYTSDTSVEATDKLLGSNAGGATKNFAVQDISKFFKNTNAAGVAAQFVYNLKQTQLNTGNNWYNGRYIF